MIAAERERRRDLRVTFRASAVLEFAGGRVFDNCRISDISVGGLFVEGLGGVATGDQCTVNFQLTGRRSTLALAMRAEVIRVRERGAALQFTEVDEDCFCHLQNIVYFNYRQEEQLGESVAMPPAGIGDQSLYLGLAAGKIKPLLGDYPGSEGDDDFNEDGEELDRDILDQVGPRGDRDDF
jgi:hypothetical protein